MAKLLLNADMGESFGPWTMGQDEAVMPFVDLANVACGFHAADPDTMRRTVALAASHGVKVGAHPAYPDLVGFGRRSLACSPAEVENMVLYQLGALHAICRAEGTRVHYVKPHGALYNDMMKNQATLAAIMRAVAAFDASLPLMLMATVNPQPAQELADQHGVTLWFEAFADRAYDAAGFLVPRSQPGAVHHAPEVIVEQARRIAAGEPLTAIDGSPLVLAAHTLCVHGDNPESIAAVAAIRRMLDGPA
ncbi:5-oxoprolinase subunit PxpA [Oceanimonas pelagia]|uniref:5-oxoprolinase subunit A n=1 Tax=Oceanimonas pelagia TaxID=3028314 RepID=A0AA50KNV4_9GAMM|nr:5-oxoprolinase subunit PxpA [Oceanimonas pelagia]WMC10422.1 5-oxoprolinase subunit PxpA [Oceanimonas pelagia]